ncbi:uncharacterized protein LOC129315360 [Prosopis cineraria]|uniref:uncharacterized protein LOC129315360 n=1 Tax=Prosopis cineraria TaxID=364024 RepID=UPI002410999B|nr:uncharacterized protein LOC129315360 [Prosopis cineraria]
MHFVLQDISTESLEVSTPGKDSLRNQEQQQISTTPSKDCEESALSGRNSDSGCPILAFLTFEPDGNWKIVALPVWCLGHTNLASGVIMEGLQLVLPPPLNGSKIDQHKGLRSAVPDYAYSLKSCMGRSNAGSNVYRRCQNKIASRAAKLNEISGNSRSLPLISSNSSDVFADSSVVVNSSNTFMSNSKADKSVKKNSRKKAKKKGKQSKKQSSDSSSTEPEVLSEIYDSASLAPEACGNNDVDDENMLISCTNGSEFSSSSDKSIRNDSERDGMDNRINLAEAPKTCTSGIDDVELPEATIPMVQKSTGESAMCNSKNQLQNNGSEFADTEGNTKDMQQNHSALYPEGLLDMPDSLALDSVSVASNSDESTNAGVVEKQSGMASCRISCSEPPVSKSEDEYLASQGLSNAVVNDFDHNEGDRYSAQNSSFGDKKVKQRRSSQSCVNKNGAGNFHCRTGKENSHSVWQKVQKNNADECNGDSKKVNATLSVCHSFLKKAPSVNRNCNADCANSLSQTDNKKHSKSQVNRKSKGKMDSDSKKGYCSYSRKAVFFNDRSIFNDSAEVGVQLNDMPHASSQENSQEVSSRVSESHSHFNSPKVELETKGNQQITSESVDNAQIHLEDSDLPKGVLRNFSTLKNQNTENQNSSLSAPSDDIDQSSVSEEQSPLHSHLSGHDVGQTEKEASSAAYNVQNSSSGSILWKWIPIGKKDTGLAISGSDSSTPEYSDKPSHEDSTLEIDAEQKEVYFSDKVSLLNESNGEPKEVSFSEKQVSISNESGTCMDQISNSFSCLDKDENKELGNRVASNLSYHKDKPAVDNYLIYECEHHEASEHYSFRIAQAINDARRVQLACETVHMATGSPIAEVERLLHKCSPFICQSSHSLRCLTCSQDNANGATLCRHVTPDLTLGCMWQWYEKHGSYGLELRAQDYTSRRLGGSHVPFRAYFVPSLSAVQLFKYQKVQCIPSRDKFCDCNISEACEIRDMSEHSSSSQHPNFSVHFPQLQNQDANIPIPKSQMHCSELSPFAADNGSVSSINSSYCGDSELLFEYFESEQPQQRQPLYEKIQELVSGCVSSQSRVFGDPTILDSVNLQDLHPRSWYSVAWYPIYRIPHGNFRASFLTYHSIGHLVHRGLKSASPTLDSCIVSPVVGLQSYNAQGECWFQLNQSAQAAEMLGLNPSVLLKERLRTLEETASLMSRSTVNTGNTIRTSRHPDYEFFLSRRR